MSVSPDPLSSIPKSKKRKHDSSSKAASKRTDENLDVTTANSEEKAAAQQDKSAVDQDGGAEEEDEVEAVSHAEARKRRKLLKKQEKSKASKATINDEDGKVESGGDEASQVQAESKPVPSGNQKRSQYGVWIGNMSFKTNEERVRHATSGERRVRAEMSLSAISCCYPVRFEST